jgi:DHA2 family multidrug resistance protein
MCRCCMGSPTPPGRCTAPVIAVGDIVRAQATIMGCADGFALLGIVLVVAILPAAWLRKGSASGGATR